METIIVERYGFNTDGTVKIRNFIEDEGRLRKQLEELFSENGLKLISERIRIPREKLVKMVSYLPHDLDVFEKYTDFQIVQTISLLQNRDNPFIIAYFANEEDRKNLVATYEINKSVSLDSYTNPKIPHPKNYNFEDDAIYIIYKARVNSKNKNTFKQLRLPNWMIILYCNFYLPML